MADFVGNLIRGGTHKTLRLGFTLVTVCGCVGVIMAVSFHADILTKPKLFFQEIRCGEAPADSCLCQKDRKTGKNY